MLVIATLPPDGPRLLRQGGFETRPYMNLDPTTLDPVCHIAYGRKWPAASDARTQPIERDLGRSGHATQLSETLAEPPRHQGWPWPRGNKIWHRPADVIK